MKKKNLPTTKVQTVTLKCTCGKEGESKTRYVPLTDNDTINMPYTCDRCAAKSPKSQKPRRLIRR